MRPSASNRLLLARVAAPTRLAPFAQVGAGEWRIDPVMFPAFPRYGAFCGQLGAGVELAVTKRLSVAGEAEYTFLYGASPWADVSTPRVLSAIVAAHATF